MRHPRFEPSNLRKSFQSCKRKPLESKKIAIFGTFLRFLVVAPSKIPHFIAKTKNKQKPPNPSFRMSRRRYVLESAKRLPLYESYAAS